MISLVNENLYKIINFLFYLFINVIFIIVHITKHHSMNSLIHHFKKGSKGLLKSQFFSLYNFSNFQGRKQIDMSKASIKLMAEGVKFQPSLDLLLQSHQMNINQAYRLFLAKHAQFSLGQQCTLAVMSQFQIFQQKYCFNKFFSVLKNAFHIPITQLKKLKCEKQNLVSVFAVIQFFQTQASPNFIRAFLSLLINQVEEYDMTNNQEDYLKIVAFLSQRMYLTQNIRNHMYSLSISQICSNNQKLVNAKDISAHFRKMSLILQIFTNLYKMEQKNIFGNDSKTKNISKELKDGRNTSKLIDLQSKITQLQQKCITQLQNPQKLSIILSRQSSKNILLHRLFQKQNKGRILKIIDQLLKSNQLLNTKVDDDFIPILFDRLLIYTTLEDYTEVVNILQNYVNCFKIINSDGNNVIDSQASFLMLVKKFNCVTQTIINHLGQVYTKFLQSAKIIQSFIGIKKNKAAPKNQKIKLTSQIATLLSLTYNFPTTLQAVLSNIFKNKINMFFQFSRMNIYYSLGSDFYAYEMDQKMYTKVWKLMQSKNYYDNKLIEQTSSQLFPYMDKIESRYKVCYDQQYFKHKRTKINFRCTPAITKVLLLNLMLHFHLETSSRKEDKLLKNLINNEEIIKIIQQYQAYPGLIENAYKLYYLIKYKDNSAQTIKQSKFEGFILKNKDYYSKIYQATIEKLKKKQDYYSIQPHLQPNIQFMHDSIKVNLDVYKNQNALSKIFKNHFILNKNQKHSNLRAKFNQFIKDNLQTRQQSQPGQTLVLPFHVDYPFILDFMILYRNQKFAVLFIDPLSQNSDTPFIENVKDIGQDPLKQQNEQTNIHGKDSFNKMFVKIFTKHFQEKNTHVILIESQEQILDIKKKFDNPLKKKLWN